MIDLRHRSDSARIALPEAERDAPREEVLQAGLILDGVTEHAIVALNLAGASPAECHVLVPVTPEPATAVLPRA